MALGATFLALLVLCAALVFVLRAWTAAEKAWRDERAELLNRVAAANPREFAILQKAVAPKDDTPQRVAREELPIGLG